MRTASGLRRWLLVLACGLGAYLITSRRVLQRRAEAEVTMLREVPGRWHEDPPAATPGVPPPEPSGPPAASPPRSPLRSPVSDLIAGGHPLARRYAERLRLCLRDHLFDLVMPCMPEECAPARTVEVEVTVDLGPGGRPLLREAAFNGVVRGPLLPLAAYACVAQAIAGDRVAAGRDECEAAGHLAERLPSRESFTFKTRGDRACAP